ncbi:hypothetical protein DQ04_01211120 [Trypanosoma grayi]|uniref:hypothetical protein n=1 Tax=Trypanosoma grayi TaxID=71804 RepID=UPI0004F41BED|nr:hypothetical protein DQ04_01211120 [Trypanosoma grayi]KEG13113.1 hypothetical protein DQ04_01211120 [Trypanosoma grayi]
MPRTRHARFSHSRSNGEHVGERKAPFMCSGSPMRHRVSPLKQLSSHTPLSPARSDDNSRTLVEVLAPALRAVESDNAAHPLPAFTLPMSTDAKHVEWREATEATLPVATVEDKKEEEEEENFSFRISEFRMPRTPQRRSSVVAASLSPLPQHATAAQRAAEAELHATNDDERCLVATNDDDEALPHPAVAEESPRRRAEEEDFVEVNPTQNDAVAASVSANEEEVVELEKEDGASTATGVSLDDMKERAEEDVAETYGDDAIHSATQPVPTPLTEDVAVTYVQEVAGASAFSSHAYECSSTTTESPDKEIVESERRQLLFDYDDETLREKETEAEVPLATLTAVECVAPTPVPEVDSCVQSQQFYECISAPSTPSLQLLDTYHQLEATRREMAVSISYQRATLRVEGRRGSLVLVSGDLPAPYTPSIQQPHTPTPSEAPRRHTPTPPPPPPPMSFSQGTATTMAPGMSLEVSPMPRPVTLRSQLPSPVRGQQAAVSAPFSMSPREGRSTPYPHTPLADITAAEDGDVRREEPMDGCTPNSAVRSLSRSLTNRKSVVERLMECCPSDVREEAELLIAADASVTRTPSRTLGSGQLSEVLTDNSSISQRVAARPRKYYYDYTYWERHLHDTTTKSAQKNQRKAKKAAKKAAARMAKKEREAQLEQLNTQQQQTVESDAEAQTSSTVAAAPSLRNSMPNLPHVTTKRSSQSHHRRNSSSFRPSLKNVVSRKNRERILLRQRRFKRRHTK